ncbi:hypothetical protein D9758_007719 [Tetrapyrgos nigripes]|uniref:Uncharacterized protein n=1 Tax=Tetrapyrgos nigripes TaxID=182062 RepID=A0A8H5LIS1_9AGAR|nr:hypothetical protein D9758_007719 [Tetrapyrgos nigripes]
MFAKALAVAPLAALIVSSANAGPVEKRQDGSDFSIPGSGLPTDINDLTSLIGGTSGLDQLTSLFGSAIPTDPAQLTSLLGSVTGDIGSALPTGLPDIGDLTSLLPSGVDIGALTSLIPSGVSIPTDAAQLSSLLGGNSITDAAQLTSLLGATATQPAGSQNTGSSGNTNSNNDNSSGGDWVTETALLARVPLTCSSPLLVELSWELS